MRPRGLALAVLVSLLGFSSAGMHCNGNSGASSCYLQIGGVYREDCAVFFAENVLAMVNAINALNGGRGFGVKGGFSRDEYFFKLNFTALTYPYTPDGFETVARPAAESLFPTLDYIVGMGAACGDGDPPLIKLAEIAEKHKRILMTTRGPQKMFSTPPIKEHFFSIHLNSDEYPRESLQQFELRGMKTAAVVYEDSGNYFFEGVGERAIQIVEESNLMSLTGKAQVKISGVEADWAALNRSIEAAVASKTDVLVVALRSPVWLKVMPLLWEAQSRHVFKATWAVNVPWGENCAGAGVDCAHVVGASQIATEQINVYKDSLIGMTFPELQKSSFWPENSDLTAWTVVASGHNVYFYDICSAVSVFVQAIQRVWRFRQLPESNTGEFLRDATSYEDLRLFMREGTLIGDTFGGPTLFSPLGQNAGRFSTTMQQSELGRASLVFPSAIATAAVVIPTPGSVQCPLNSYRNYSLAKCPLCAHECVSCPQGMQWVADEVCGCAPGYFSALQKPWELAPPPGEMCERCPTGANCDDGRFVLEAGYWRGDDMWCPDSACSTSGLCDKSLCHPLIDAGASGSSHPPAFCGSDMDPCRRRVVVVKCGGAWCLQNSTCAEGHEGPLCDVCSENYVATSNGQCRFCDPEDQVDNGLRYGAIGLIAALVLLFWIVVVWLPIVWPANTSEGGSDPVKIGNVFDRISTFMRTMRQQGFIHFAKVTIAFYQVLAAFPVSYNIEYDKAMVEFFMAAPAANLNFTSIPWLNCFASGLSYQNVVMGCTVGFACFLVISWLPIVVIKIVGKHWYGDTEGHPSYSIVQMRTASLISFFVFLMYPWISSLCFNVFWCHPSLKLLMVDKREACPTNDSSEFLFVYGMACSIFFAFGLPLGLLLVLRSKGVPAMASDKLNSSMTKALIQKYRTEGSSVEIELLRTLVGDGGHDQYFAHACETLFSLLDQAKTGRVTVSQLYEYLYFLGLEIPDEGFVYHCVSQFYGDWQHPLSREMFHRSLKHVMLCHPVFSEFDDKMHMLTDEQLTVLALHDWDGKTPKECLKHVPTGLEKGSSASIPPAVVGNLHRGDRGGGPVNRADSSKFSSRTSSTLTNAVMRGGRSSFATSSLASTLAVMPSSAKSQLKALSKRAEMVSYTTREQKMHFLHLIASKLQQQNRLPRGIVAWSQQGDSGRLREDMAVRRWGSVFVAYKVQYWYGEVVEMMRKLLLTSVINFIFPGTHMQLAVGTIIMVAALYFTLNKRPYVVDALNDYQAWCFTLIIINGVYGFTLMVDKELEEVHIVAVDGVLPILLVVLNATLVFQPLIVMTFRYIFSRGYSEKSAEPDTGRSRKSSCTLSTNDDLPSRQEAAKRIDAAKMLFVRPATEEALGVSWPMGSCLSSEDTFFSGGAPTEARKTSSFGLGQTLGNIRINMASSHEKEPLPVEPVAELLGAAQVDHRPPSDIGDSEWLEVRGTEVHDTEWSPSRNVFAV